MRAFARSNTHHYDQMIEAIVARLSRKGVGMQSYGLTLMLKDDEEIVERYKDYHRNAWPEVIARLREIGIVDMKIYLIGRRMFMYLEADDGFDPERDFPKLNEVPRYREWDELMRTLQERAPEARADEWWAAMEEVFDLSPK